MMHGPCGLLNKNSPCMKDGICSKHYPAALLRETKRDETGYLKYRCLTDDDGFKLNIKFEQSQLFSQTGNST